MYRDKFLELYGPKSPDPMEVIRAKDLLDKGDGGDDQGPPLGVIAVLLLALGALLYLTRR
jgi:hypothetical protein